jgi:hypothetical protein
MRGDKPPFPLHLHGVHRDYFIFAFTKKKIVSRNRAHSAVFTASIGLWWMPIPVAIRPTVQICGRLVTRIGVWNPADGINVRVWCLLCR